MLERLRILATDNQTTPAVRKKVQSLFVGWSQDLNGQRGYERLAELYKQLPQHSRKARPQPKYLSNDPHELEEDEGESSPSGSAGPSSGVRSRSNTTSGSGSGNRSRSNTVENHHTDKKKVKKQPKPAPAPLPRIDLAKERPKIQQTLAEASSAATNLMNALRLINWEQELSTDNKKATECFNKCRRLRKQVLRYIHSIESEEFIGSLLHTNEELIQALQKYDKMSQAPDEDSDSDYENDDWKVESGMRKLNVSDRRNHRDSSDTGSDVSDEEEDDDNPFGDSNKIKTPVDERAYIRY